MKKIFLLIPLVLLCFAMGAKRYKPIVTTSLCTNCNECINACPVDAIGSVQNKAVINPEKCVGCMICVNICSWGAVE